MPAKKKTPAQPLTAEALVKETCRRIRVARALWKAHNNPACRGERTQALALYESLSEAGRGKVPQELRVWLRYRSEKYFGEDRTPPGDGREAGGRANLRIDPVTSGGDQENAANAPRSLPETKARSANTTIRAVGSTGRERLES